MKNELFEPLLYKIIYNNMFLHCLYIIYKHCCFMLYIIFIHYIFYFSVFIFFYILCNFIILFPLAINV